MKKDTLLKTLQAQNANGAWITDPTNIYYLTGFHSEPHERLLAYLIDEDGNETMICPQLDVEEVKQSPFEGQVIGYLDTESPFTHLQHTFERLLIEETHLTVQRYHELRDAFNVKHFDAIDMTLKQMRNIKTPSELEILKQATQLADRCIEIGTEFLKEGVTEREVVNHIENAIKLYGVNEMSFDTMVLFGDHAAAPHGVPGDRKLQQDEYVLFDLGVIYHHYCSDITRTVAFGNPSAEAQSVYDVVLKAEEAAIAMVKPGVSIKALDDKARGIIEDAGYGDYFPHRLGHGLGLSVHEFPDISNTNDDVLQEGMTFTIEPGIYVPNKVGVRIEDDIYVTQDGYTILTKSPK
ncbi:M24 family metallopeptidase [Staphylococcus sp. 11261D007BR]